MGSLRTQRQLQNCRSVGDSLQMLGWQSCVQRPWWLMMRFPILVLRDAHSIGLLVLPSTACTSVIVQRPCHLLLVNRGPRVSSAITLLAGLRKEQLVLSIVKIDGGDLAPNRTARAWNHQGRSSDASWKFSMHELSDLCCITASTNARALFTGPMRPGKFAGTPGAMTNIFSLSSAKTATES